MARTARRAFENEGAVSVRARSRSDVPAAGDPPERPDPIPLDIRPLLTPYKKRGRLLVRIERMQPRARLSAGRNNGDGSWSLASDELEDLCYLPAVKVTDPHTLAVRIVEIDPTGGSTLAVLDYVVSPDSAGPAATTEANGPDTTVELGQLRDEAQQLANRLAAREEELAAAQAEVEKTRAELARELDARQTELGAEIAAAEQRSSDRIAKLRDTWTRETETKLVKAKQEWKAAETARLAAAETVWRERADQMLAKTRAAAASAGDEGRTEIGRLKGELTALRKRLAARENEVATLQSASVEDRGRIEREFEAARAKTEDDWKAAEAARFAAAEKRWQAETERLLAEATTNAGKKERIKFDKLTEELAALRGTLAERDSQVEQLQSARAEDRARMTREFEEVQAKAERDWKAGEAGRFAAAEKRWQAETERLLAEVTTNAGNEERIQFDKLTEELTTLRGSLAERESEVVALQSAGAEDRARLTREFEEAQAKAEQDWKAGEAVRFAAAEKRWQAETERLLAEVTTNAGNEERIQFDKLTEELTTLRGSLAERESEVAALELTGAEDRARLTREFEDARAKAEQDWEAAEATRFSAAEAHWQTEIERLLAEAATNTGNEERIQFDKLTEELAALRGSLAERENEVAALQSASAEERARMKREFEEARARTEQDWKAGEVARLAAAEARWREETDGASAALRARCERAEAALEDRATPDFDEATLHRLRADLAALEKTLAERDDEMGHLRARLAESDMREPLPTDDTGRLESLKSQLEQATVRYEEAEAALTEIRQRRQPQDSGDVAHLNDEIAMLQTMLAHAKRELAVLRPAGEPVDHSTQQSANKKTEGDAKSKGGRSLFRETVVVVAVLMAAIIFAPQIASRLPYEWQAALPAFLLDNQSAGGDLDLILQKLAVPHHDRPVAVVIRPVNLRRGPSIKADNVTVLAKGTKVTEIERHGGWTHVMLREASGNRAPRQGWVYNSYLKPKADGAKATGRRD